MIQEMHGYTDQYYFVTATSFVDCPDYHLMDEDAKKAYHAQKEKNKDYLCLMNIRFSIMGPDSLMEVVTMDS